MGISDRLALLGKLALPEQIDRQHGHAAIEQLADRGGRVARGGEGAVLALGRDPDGDLLVPVLRLEEDGGHLLAERLGPDQQRRLAVAAAVHVFPADGGQVAPTGEVGADVSRSLLSVAGLLPPHDAAADHRQHPAADDPVELAILLAG